VTEPASASASNSRWLLSLLSLLSGAAAVLAFAPFELWPLLPFCIAVVFSVVYRSASPRQSFLHGYLFGMGYFGAGVYWVYYSLHLFGDAIAPLAAVGTFLFVAALAFFPAFFALMAYRLKGLAAGSDIINQARSRTLWMLLVAPAAWVFIEWIRSWMFTGFPWLSLGYATLHSPIAAYAPVGGVFLNSLMVAFCAGAVALFGCMLFAKRWYALHTLAAAGFVGAIVVGGLLLDRVQWTTVAGDPVRVKMVQGNIKQELKFVPNLLQDSLDLYSSMSFSDDEADTPELIIWPESAIPAFFSDVQGWIDGFVEEANRRGTTVISGGFLANEDYTEYYNAIKVLGGTEAQSYTKRHLVPFGEFMPFRSLLSLLARYIMIPMSDLTAGHGPITPIEVNGIHYGMSICYEDAFGEEMKVQLPLANVLINVSNDAWFGDSTAPHQHQEIAAMRALEFQRPMLRVTNTGISSMISRHGEIVVYGPQHEAVALDVEVVPRSGSTLFVTVGNWLVVALVLLILLWRWVAIRF
jgi:apolipoprotein N-acyltransferase